MWKDELIEILFSSDPSKLNVEKAINLKYENTPSFLYKYKDFNDKYSLELLKSNKMYLSRPSEFNDPFDCALKMAAKDLNENYIRNVLLKYIFDDLYQKGFNVSHKEFMKLRREKNLIHHLAKFICKKTKPNISLNERFECIKNEKKAFKEGYLDLGLKDNIQVTCFSETYKSILMWSHYAGQHKGFCIKYDFKELGLNNPRTRFIFPVIYQNTVFDMKEYIPDSNKNFDNVLKKYMGKIRPEDILKGLELPQSTTKTNNMVVFYNALVKSKVWSYEKEWRYVFPYKNIKYKAIYLPVPKPKAIYLGAMADKKNCRKVIEIAKEKNISVYKMQIKPSEFALKSTIIQKC